MLKKEILSTSETIITNQNDINIDWNNTKKYSTKLTENNRIKKHKNDCNKIYSFEPYAQELYELYVGVLSNIKEPKIGDVILSKVIAIEDNIAIIDINWRETAILDLKKENEYYIDYIKVGNNIEVLVEDIYELRNDSYIKVSFSTNIINKKKQELINSIDQNCAYEGLVSEIIDKAGYFIDIDDIRCFMPGSLGGINKLVNFEDLLNKKIYVIPINYSKEKDYIVVSHREYLKKLIPEKIKELELGKEYEGFITGINRKGVFVEFNECLTGLILTNNLDVEYLNKFNKNELKAGNSIKFKISNIISNDKINLTQNEIEIKKSKWDDEDILSKYRPYTYYSGKIKNITNFGAFIELEEGLTGLIHISNIPENLDLSINQIVDVKILNINKEEQKINFSF